MPRVAARRRPVVWCGPIAGVIERGTTPGARRRPSSEERLLRKIAAAILAVPVFVAVYLPVARRRGAAIRAGLAVGVGLLVLVAAVGSLPRAASALPPAVAAERFGPNVESRQALD